MSEQNMTQYITLICLSLILVAFVYFFYSHLKWKLLERKCKAAFDHVYEQSSPRPKYKMGNSYGFPQFTVTFASKADLEAAHKNGLNQRFSKEIKELCKNTGSKENPFQVKQAIYFGSDEFLENS